MIVVTRELLNEGKSSNNGWNNAQVEAILGHPLPNGQLYSGWFSDMIGRECTQEQIDMFLSLKNAHFKDGHKQRLKENRKNRVNTDKLPQFIAVKVDIPWSDQYLHPNWQKMRLWVLSRDNFSCVSCKSMDKTLHAHHLKYIKGKNVWEVPHWYIVTLCEDCHSEEHGRDLRAKT